MQTCLPRRAIAWLLLCACIVPGILLTGCGMFEDTSLDACTRFLEHLRAGEYGEAYEMLYASVRYDESHAAADLAAAQAARAKEIEEALQRGEDVSELRAAEIVPVPSKTRISKEAFIARYTNIFEALEIQGFSFAIRADASVEGDVISVYTYTLEYDSPLLADERLEFRMSVRRDNNQWTIEWAPYLLFPDMQWGDSVRVGSTAPKRGEILADGKVYAQTVNAVSILAYPKSVEDRAQFARQISALSGLQYEDILKTLDKTPGDFTILRQYYPDEFSEALEQQYLDITGISVDKTNFGTLRDYPQEDMLAHILGYVGPITPDELVALTGSKEGNELYNVDSIIGKTGLEQVYEAQLHGKPGRRIYIADELGGTRQVLYEEKAQDGLDLQLTLNADLQERTDKLLEYTLYGDTTAGAVIVMDPTTGKLEAMSSYPSYDLNLFTRGMTPAQWEVIRNQPNSPLFNRLTSGRYAPGSMFKPITAAAALESGAMTTETAFPEHRGEDFNSDNELIWIPSDTGEFGPWRYGPITRVTLNHRHHPLNMLNGMKDSDNVYFAYAALRTGIEYFANYTDGVGMNEAIPFEVPVNAAQMKNAELNGEPREWNPMLLAESAYGQGEVLVTPLQAACTFSAFANGGSIMQPYIVEGLYRVDGIGYVLEEPHTPVVWKQNVIAASSVSTIVPMLEAVVTDGTGRTLDMDNVAGKTGTAQIGNDRRREISWFAGFRLHTESPRLVLVMLEIPANDALSASKFEIARALLEYE